MVARSSLNTRVAVATLIASVGCCEAWTATRGIATYRKLPWALGVFDKQRDMIDFMNEPVDNSVGDKTPKVPPEQDDLADMVRCVVKAADGRKAESIVALRVSSVSTLTSFLVILSGNSRPQNQAIAAAIQGDMLKEYEMRPGGNGVPEGTADSGWMVLDYGSVMVHIMTPKSRLYYNVEGQWKEKGGEYMDISEVIIPNIFLSPQMGGTMDLQKDEDPFWS